MENFKLKELQLEELDQKTAINCNAGFLAYVPLIVAAGAAAAWVFEKGEGLGKAIAKNH